VLVGDKKQLKSLARKYGVSLRDHTILQPGSDMPVAQRQPGAPSPLGGAAQLLWIDTAVDLVSSGQARALVTGPVSKEVIAASGAPGSALFRGHTEHLQQRLGAKEVVMAFWSKRLVTSLVTTHVPLSHVAKKITQPRVASATFWLAWLLHRLNPHRIKHHLVIAGLNPHAGEAGLLGQEEIHVLQPAMADALQRAKKEGLSLQLSGPLGAETAFRYAYRGDFDGVVAMYHDQATIPLKLVAFHQAVNVSLGLPIVRTSVDHGTGYDVAGTGQANPDGFLAALQLAHRLTCARS